MNEIGVIELKKLIDEGAGIQLIDVREDWEHQFANIGGLNIPMANIEEIAKTIDNSKQVIIYCRSGKRSGNIIEVLENQYGIKGLYNLVGGILDWSDKIDSSVQKY